MSLELRTHISSVAYHPNTGHLASIGMIPALVGCNIRYEFFVLYIWLELFFKFCGNSFLKNPREIQSGAEYFKIPKYTN